QMKRFDNPKAFELFVVVSRNPETDKPELHCHYDYEFTSEQAKQQYVLSALQNNVLFCYRLLLSRTGRPDTDFIAPELSYISAYAIHKAKQLEEELWSVAGVIDAIDISTEIVWRFGAPSELSQQHYARQQALLAQLQKPVP